MAHRNRIPRTRTHAWIRNNIVGLVALFVALSGTTYAAQSLSDVHAQNAVSGKKAAKKKAKRGPAGAQGAQGAQGPAGPAGAPGGASSNALTLGGIPAASYQQRCAPGAVFGLAYVDPALLTGTYANLTTGNTNCTGGTVQGKTNGAGDISIKFNGSGAAFAIVSCAIGTCSESSVGYLGPGEFHVLTGNSTGTLMSGPFYIVAI
jgi:hypothetical protein